MSRTHIPDPYTQVPALHVNCATPVTGATVSLTFADEPGTAALTGPLQDSPPTVQPSIPDAQFGGGGGELVHVALLAPLHDPLLHVKSAVPTPGAVPSDTVLVTPLLDAGTDPLQV